MLLITIFLLVTQVIANQTEDDNDVLQETLRMMLGFNKVPKGIYDIPQQTPSRQASEYMKELYNVYVNDDGNDDGNIARSIQPFVGKVDGQEVLIFDVSNIGEELVMRAEVHFHLRRRGAARRRLRALSAKSLCTNEYCVEAQYLPHMEPTDDGVIWDATKALVETHALGGKQLVIRITRKDVKMRTYSEMVRRSAPFLLVYSQADNVLDGEKVEEEVARTLRRRREANGEYYLYHESEETSTPSEKSRKEMNIYEEAASKRTKKTRNNGKSMKLRAERRRKQLKDDLWAGFGVDPDEDENEDSSDDHEITSSEKTNDVRVVLLESAGKEKACAKRSLSVNFNELGWTKFVISPNSFEAGYCSGTCDYPLKKASNPTNHAVLQSLLLPSSTSTVCCSPSEMESLTVLFHDQHGQMVIKNFPNMIVRSCSCN